MEIFRRITAQLVNPGLLGLSHINKNIPASLAAPLQGCRVVKSPCRWQAQAQAADKLGFLSLNAVEKEN